MKNFDFNPVQFHESLQIALQPLQLSLRASNLPADQQAMQMITALTQSIDIMQRADADDQKAQAITPQAATEIAEYVFNLLDELAVVVATRGMQQQMLQLHRLSLPVAVWLHNHHGIVTRLDILVNAIASYANELTAPPRLEELSDLAERIVAMVADDIQRDIDNTDPRRPWRVLNLNWGIIATRSHNPLLMERTYDQLLKNIPQDARSFFSEGMQQMAIINYPQQVKDVMEKYYRHFVQGERQH